jgi:hypothetical protein
MAMPHGRVRTRHATLSHKNRMFHRPLLWLYTVDPPIRQYPRDLTFQQARKHFFFEKKKQKTFMSLGQCCRNVRDSDHTFFGSFFQKRTLFLTFSETPGVLPL